MKNYHNKLFPYAYNILGSSEDAKDAIQDVLMKYLSIEKGHIKNETGYLIKAVTNQSINIKKRNQKIIANRMWLPEPISTEIADSNINGEEIISYSMLVLLEKLTAKERAVFILKNAFEYSHEEISLVIDSTIENSRKLLSRATKKISNSSIDTNQNTPTSFIKNYVHAIQNGDVSKLEKMLSEEISLHADGGKNIKVVRELTVGKAATLDLLFFVFKTHQKSLSVKISKINHQPALLFYKAKILINCQVFELEGNKIKNIFSIIDPNKLKSLSL
ncbi:sigma factor-like helix-turn-helix DNA-binding protein [Spongiimicrobium sp. 3-5]|uniref:sigma factor-like helix-turn-helix DNA-binding protein n=1 Tax=Spongiimicrobium sp. 3-5 TaxID=3332596 RepID=UPI00397F6E73